LEGIALEPCGIAADLFVEAPGLDAEQSGDRVVENDTLAPDLMDMGKRPSAAGRSTGIGLDIALRALASLHSL